MKYYLDLSAAELPESHQKIPRIIPLAKQGRGEYVIAGEELSQDDCARILQAAQNACGRQIIAPVYVTRKGLPKGAKIITQSEE